MIELSRRPSGRPCMLSEPSFGFIQAKTPRAPEMPLAICLDLSGDGDSCLAAAARLAKVRSELVPDGECLRIVALAVGGAGAAAASRDALAALPGAPVVCHAASGALIGQIARAYQLVLSKTATTGRGGRPGATCAILLLDRSFRHCGTIRGDDAGSVWRTAVNKLLDDADSTEPLAKAAPPCALRPSPVAQAIANDPRRQAAAAIPSARPAPRLIRKRGYAASRELEIGA